MAEIDAYLGELGAKLEQIIFDNRQKYKTLPELEIALLANIKQILSWESGNGSGGSSGGITEAQVREAIESADLSAIASQVTLAEIDSKLLLTNDRVDGIEANLIDLKENFLGTTGTVSGSLDAIKTQLQNDLATLKTNTGRISQYQFQLAEDANNVVFVLRFDSVAGTTTTFTLAGASFTPVSPYNIVADGSNLQVEPNEFEAITNSAANWAIGDILTRILIINTSSNATSTIWQSASGATLSVTPAVGTDVIDTDRQILASLKLAATSSLQTSGNTLLNNINSKLQDYFEINESGQNIWGLLSNLFSTINQSISYNPGASGYANSIAGRIEQLVQRIQIKSANTLPQPSDTAIIATLRDNVNTSKSLTITGNGSALNAIVIPSTNVGDYAIISFQISGTFSAQFIVEGSNNEINWYEQPTTSINQIGTGNNFAPTIPRIYNVTKQTKFVRLRISAHTGGTVEATLYLSNISGYSNPLVLPSSIVVDSELPSAIQMNVDSINQSALMPYLGSVGLSYNNASVFVRNRSCNIGAGEGLGRQKVTVSTEIFDLLVNVSVSGNGTGLNLGSIYNQMGAQLIVVSGTLTAINWKLEGSFNNLNWFDLESSTSIVNGSAIFSSGKLFQYIRASIVSINGTSPVVTIKGGANG